MYDNIQTYKNIISDLKNKTVDNTLKKTSNNDTSCIMSNYINITFLSNIMLNFKVTFNFCISIIKCYINKFINKTILIKHVDIIDNQNKLINVNLISFLIRILYYMYVYLIKFLNMFENIYQCENA